MPERPAVPAHPAAVLVVSREAEPGAAERTRVTIQAQSVSPPAGIVVADPTMRYLESLRDVARRYPGHDVVCMRAGVELPFAWDARLAKAAYADAGIAAAVPMCDASTLHSLVEGELREAAGPQWPLIDRSAYCMGARGYYETPAIHPVCAYVRHDALDSLGELEEADADDARTLDLLARRWRAVGRMAVVCDYIYVGYDGAELPASRGADPTDVAAFALHNPLGSVRRALNDALRSGLPPVSTPALDSRPVQLHIMHFWGGGLDKWVRDFCRADSRRTNLMLATYRIGEQGGQRIVLYSDPDARVPIRTWDIARPLRSTALASIEYRAILEQVIREFDVESIVVSSLIGHSLDALRQRLPTVVVSHDFYPICQAINPRFDAACRTCRSEELESCGRSNPHFLTLGSPTPAEWNALRDAYVAILLERAIEMVVPSPSVAETMKRLEPRLGPLSIRVIPHGTGMAGERLAPAPLEASGRMRIVVMGRLVENKGADLLRAAAPQLRQLADVTLVGCGPHAMPLARECGWAAIEGYRLEELPGILRSIHPHAGILASVVPETFSYTLSELWAMGIPPLATALGSFRDRIRDGVDGFLFEPDAAALVQVVQGLRAEPARLASAATAIASMEVRTPADMVRDYDTLLPSEPRAVARFAVGIGTKTALTEPYRLIEEAYAHLKGAYEQLSRAYAETGAAYTHVNAEYGRVSAELARLRDLCERYSRELESLHVGLLWWRAPEVGRLVVELRRKMHAPAAAIADDAKDPKT